MLNDYGFGTGEIPFTIEASEVGAERKQMPTFTAPKLNTFEKNRESFYAQNPFNQKKKQKMNFSGLFGGFSGKAPGWLGDVANGVGAMTKPFTQLNETASQTSLSIRDSLSDAAINSGIPLAQALGAVAKIVDAAGDATGFHIDDIDKNAGSKAGVNGGIRLLNNAMNAIPGNSLVMAAFSPQKTVDANNLNEYGEAIASAYSGSQSDIDAAKKLAGKRTLFGIGQNKMDDFINDTNSSVSIINEIGRTNSLAKRSDYSSNIAQQNLNRYSGTNYQTYAVGKEGMKILSKKELQDIMAARKLQNGGVIGTDSNIIPEGALHARLNHLQDINPDLEDTTRKGIPVLDESGEQVAEIERNEIILRLDLTKKVEELMKDGSEQAMIECGKLLTQELIENTQDNTGQLTEEVENGK